MTAGVEVPVSLHLDHCPDRSVITECLKMGWNSVLFDGSRLAVEENARQTAEVVVEARITVLLSRVRSNPSPVWKMTSVATKPAGGSRWRWPSGSSVPPRSTSSPPPSAMPMGCTSSPDLDMQRVTDIVARQPIPIALHGGTGMSDAQFADLISRGCAKINISTALKMAFMQSSLAHLESAQAGGKWDPPSMFGDVRAAVMQMASAHIRRFASAGKAW